MTVVFHVDYFPNSLVTKRTMLQTRLMTYSTENVSSIQLFVYV